MHCISCWPTLFCGIHSIFGLPLLHRSQLHHWRRSSPRVSDTLASCGNQPDCVSQRAGHPHSTFSHRCVVILERSFMNGTIGVWHFRACVGATISCMTVNTRLERPASNSVFGLRATHESGGTRPTTGPESRVRDLPSRGSFSYRSPMGRA
jgi:hypothetical protein